ncbi:MAG: hypothetical protein GX601_08515 [Anaerolineales bacterium]|nr:hypothetical protein [Anaerolineales bacterium]
MRLKSRTSALVVLGVGAVVLAAALALLCAATVDPEWLLLAILLLAAGVALVVWGSLSLRRLAHETPENLSDRITVLARAHEGEVTLSQAVAELTMPDEAVVQALNLLERRGRAYRERQGDREVYVFPELQPQKVARRCPYCGTELPVKQAVYRCPNCGGDLRLSKE